METLQKITLRKLLISFYSLDNERLICEFNGVSFTERENYEAIIKLLKDYGYFFERKNIKDFNSFNTIDKNNLLIRLYKTEILLFTATTEEDKNKLQKEIDNINNLFNYIIFY